MRTPTTDTRPAYGPAIPACPNCGVRFCLHTLTCGRDGLCCGCQPIDEARVHDDRYDEVMFLTTEGDLFRYGFEAKEWTVGDLVCQPASDGSPLDAYGQPLEGRYVRAF